MRVSKTDPKFELQMRKAEDVRCLWRTTRLSQREIGKRVGWSQPMVRRIVLGLSWVREEN
jgi:predicted transcriptional regulator